MRGGEIPAVEIEVVLLLTVIGKRLPGDLPSSDAPTVGEHREKQCIHASPFLEHIENFLGTLIHKRDCSDLNADHFGGCRKKCWSRNRQCSTGAGSDLQEFAAIHIRVQHEFLL